MWHTASFSLTIVPATLQQFGATLLALAVCDEFERQHHILGRPWCASLGSGEVLVLGGMAQLTPQ